MWKQIPGFNDYYVSTTGKILSLKKEKPLIMKQSDDGKGYRVVNLAGDVTFVHRAVAAAFLDLDINDSHQCVMHRDDNPTNNNLSNLVIGTQIDNMADMYRKGRNKRPDVKITDYEVMIIKERLQNGETGSKLSKEYGVSSSLISSIKHKKRRFNVKHRSF